MPATTSAGLSIDSATAAVLTHAIYIETQSGTTITNGLYMGNAGTFTTAIRLAGTISNTFAFTNNDSGIVHGGAAAAAVAGYVKLLVGATAYRIPYLVNADS